MPLYLESYVSIVSRPDGRPERSPPPCTLSLRKPPKGPRGSACMLSNLDPHRGSTKYKLRENIEEVISDTEEGKATIRLKEPEVDICLNTGDVKQLKIFMSGVKKSYQGSKQECLPGPNLSPRKRLKR